MKTADGLSLLLRDPRQFVRRAAAKVAVRSGVTPRPRRRRLGGVEFEYAFDYHRSTVWRMYLGAYMRHDDCLASHPPTAGKRIDLASLKDTTDVLFREAG